MKVLICGAGIAGLTLALCLERRGHAVLIVEQSPRLRDDGYMIDFFGSGYDAIERLGLLTELAAIHEPLDRVVFLDGNGLEQVSVPYPVLRIRLFGDRHFNFMRGNLERVLHRHLQSSTILFDTTVDSYHQEDRRVRVRLSDGTTHDADLLVGADGVYSRVREVAFGDGPFVRTLGYDMGAFIIDSPPPTLDVGRDVVTVTVPRRQVTVYPVRGGRLATFFLHQVAPNTDRASHNSPCSALREVYGDLRWHVPQLLDQCERLKHVYFDRVVQVDLPRWSTGRVVLIGDACQCVSPLAGQGASMAIAGAFILGELLETGSNVEPALAFYERTLKPMIRRQQEAGRRVAHWFVPTSAWRVWVRNVMTRASLLPPVARVLRRRMAAASIFGP